MVLDLPGGLFEQRDVRETPVTTSSSSSSTSILAPIGSIIPWLKSYTNTPQALPTGWAECDGALVSDADSVFDGQNLPDLNGGEFMRGFTTSGGTGGSDTMAHTHTGPSHTHTGPSHTHTVSGTTSQPSATFEGQSGSSCTTAGRYHTHTWSDTSSSSGTGNTGAGGTGNTGAASNAENRPSYYNVVWIIRYK